MYTHIKPHASNFSNIKIQHGDRYKAETVKKVDKMDQWRSPEVYRFERPLWLHEQDSGRAPA